MDSFEKTTTTKNTTKNMLIFIILALILILIGIIYKLVISYSNDENGDLKILSGRNRYQTSIDISSDVYDTSKYVILASGSGFADALSGSQLAYALKAPILLTESNVLTEGILQEIHRLKAEKIYILGGASSISKKLEVDLSKEFEVKRLSGTSRYDTSKKIMNETKKFGKYKKIVLASGEIFQDAISASNYVCSKDALLLLVDRKNVRKIYEDTTVVGSIGKNITDPDIIKVSGKDVYETSYIIAKDCYKKSKNIVLASGEDYPDALTAISLVSKYDAPIVLTKKDKISDSVSKYIGENDKNIIVAGGKSSVDIASMANDILKYSKNRKSMLGLAKKSKSKKQVSIKDIDIPSLKYVKFMGKEKDPKIIYPNQENVVAIYKFFGDYGELVVTQINEEIENGSYNSPKIWLCSKNKQPELIKNETNLGCSISEFRILEKDKGYFLGLALQYSGGGSGALTDLVGIAFDKNGKYMYGPYDVGASREFYYFEIKEDQKNLIENVGYNSSGVLEFGDNINTPEELKKYNKEYAGSYCISDNFHSGGGHFWEIRPVYLVKSNSNPGWSIESKSMSERTTKKHKSKKVKLINKKQISNNKYFIDDKKMIRIKLPYKFEENVGFKNTGWDKGDWYNFYIKKARAKFERKNGMRDVGGDLGSIAILEKGEYDRDDDMRENPTIVPIATLRQGDIYYTVLYCVTGDSPQADSEREEKEYKDWSEKSLKMIKNIEGINGTTLIKNEVNMDMLGI